MYKLQAIVSGRVQRVMYRDFIKRKARKLNIRGFVQNLKDGKVLIEACGEKDALNTLLDFSKKGSLLARVDNIDFALHCVKTCDFDKKFYIKF